MTLARGQRLDAYRCEGGKRLIEVRLRELRQLFNTLDPAPFHEKDLDSSAEEYITSAMREVGSHPSRLLLHLPPGTMVDDAHGAVTAIRNYFAYRRRHAREQLRLLLARGVISLLIGLAFLVVCLSLRELLQASVATPMPVVSEGLLILGWVAMWKPVEIFLYDWWPEVDKGRLFERIAHMEIETQTGARTAVVRDDVSQARLAGA